MSEKFPNPDFSAGELALIEKLRSRGVEDAEAMQQLQAWTEAQEAHANEINTSRANIEVNLRRAKLYNAAGFRKEAWEILNDVRRQASQENEQDLLQAAEVMMDEMDRS